MKHFIVAPTLKNAQIKWDALQGVLTLAWVFDREDTRFINVYSWGQGCKVDNQLNQHAPDYSLVDIGDWLLDSENASVKAWRKTIPEDILLNVQSLPNSNAELLELSLFNPVVADLLISNPLLLWIMYIDHIRRQASMAEFLSAFQLKQKEILAQLGHESSRQVVNILRKFSTTHLSAVQIGILLKLLKNPNIRNYLSHLEKPTISNIMTVYNHPWLLDYPARALIPELEDRDTRLIFQDAIRMSRGIGRVSQCRTSDQLHRLHEVLLQQMLEMGTTFIAGKDGNNALLPEPPVKGNQYIIPLTTQEEIYREGQHMKHCVASYISEVMRGHSYIYKMLYPDRATIRLNIRKKGGVRLDEAKRACNAPVSPKAMNAIKKWLNDNQRLPP